METAEFRSTVSIKEGKKMQTTSEAQFKKKKKATKSEFSSLEQLTELSSDRQNNNQQKTPGKRFSGWWHLLPSLMINF